MVIDGERRLCVAKTQEGQPCKLRALPDSLYCHIHGSDPERVVESSLEVIPVSEDALPEPVVDIEPIEVEKDLEVEGLVSDADVEELHPVETIEHEGEFEIEVTTQVESAKPELVREDSDDWREIARGELKRMEEQIDRDSEPDQTLRPVTPDQVVQALDENLDRVPPELRARILEGLQELLESEWLEPETWRGIAYVLQIFAETQADIFKRRFSGDYEVDKWGYDPEFADYMLPVAGFFFNKYWRVEMTGVEHIPNYGRVLLVSNHSGVLPLDGAMISYGIREYHPAHRLTRALVANWFPTLPFFSMFLNKTGQVVAHPDNGRRLLAEDEVVLVFPEGYKGVGKLFKDRYKLARFGRGGFVKMAMKSQAPILPVSVVGAEETYPMLYNARPMAKLLGFPFFPVTPTFPWLGLFGVIPAPTKWYIDIGEPIDTSQYDPELATNPAFVSELTDLIQNKVQEQINLRLEQRQSVILG